MKQIYLCLTDVNWILGDVPAFNRGKMPQVSVGSNFTGRALQGEHKPKQEQEPE